jgi:hypothetical protein
MATIDNLRNSIIDKLLTITDKDYLTAIHQIVESSNADSDYLKLTEEQKTLLQLSEKDIKTGKLVSQTRVDSNDLKWLK